MRLKSILLALSLLSVTTLGACGGVNDDLAYASPDMFDAPIDPSDQVLRDSISQHLVATKGPQNSQYEYTRVDLNGDGLREGLVLFNLPHSYWCGWSGCTMAVFQAGDNSFKLVSETSRIRGPVVVGSTKTNGWEDIGVRLSGLDDYDRNVLLKFDGETYPANPINEDKLPYNLAALSGLRVFP